MLTLKKVDILNKPYKIYADYVESGAIDQFVSAMEQDYVVQGALMPDVHSGYSLPIGAVVACKGVIVPAYVGYDIGCGMCAVPTSFDKEEVIVNSKAIFDEIYRKVPVGFAHHAKGPKFENVQLLCGSSMTPVVDGLLNKGAMNQLGTLGGGNHFIEIGYDENDRVWIIVHSGSRNLGHSVATHYMKLASGSGKAKEGHYGLDFTSNDGLDYVLDMTFCLKFALANREYILDSVGGAVSRFVSGDLRYDGLINRNHNHAEYKDGLWIHRKGATHAEKGMMGVIPGNMRDGSFIVEGLGNPDSLYSSSHGAGRVMGRSAAKKNLDMDTFKEDMKGITARIEDSTLDESAGAYKNIFDVMDMQKDLVAVKHHIKPLINIKG